jgi:hypothetical protein
MKTIERFVTSAPVEVVWQLLTDVEHWRDWTPTILAITPLTEEGLRVGARYSAKQPGLLPAVYEVTHYIPNETFTWVQKLPGGELIGDHRVAARDGATEVQLSFYSKGLFANIAAMLFSGKIRNNVAIEATCLEERCDAMMTSQRLTRAALQQHEAR